jgi:hypothetical protein
MRLNMAEAFALKRSLEDPDFKVAIEAFFKHSADEARNYCCAAMLSPPKIELGIGFAAQAQFADECLNKLEAFVNEQLSQQ